ncbi:Anthranilate phosphoribosyltransferase [hydrothermal vent metagenome]|uniref:Anthranilate phosphoribosyltransferase n=1 Tax=hydrothermal vent metagenome TaxID=652676 RepID=A0A3B0VIA2_9ZZZZ
MAIRTIFNILGPLTNPAAANVYLLGVYEPALTEIMAEVLNNFGVKRALVVCGAGNIDEITTTGTTRVSETDGHNVTTYNINPEDYGLAPATLTDIKGGETAQESARQLRDVLSGKPGPCYDVVVFNAGAALWAAGRAADIASGIELARQTIDSGAALIKLEALAAFCGNDS